ncbi:hypothetical protein H4R21_000473 [Coemansia helicoidea]|uniref:Uncharacterized protein n=1 Tax=Coemansia helicoidea TaxID=1286919 RepID=A0ACC1LG30_9FUNG|nr:hypothetical protein H4R21_000473 [Coemansia helicoidea]
MTSSCEQSLAAAYDVVSKIDRLVEKAYDAHTSIYRTFSDLSGVSTIRKDKSVAEAAHKDIKATLDAMQDMVAALAQLAGVVERLEKQPRERLVSEEVCAILGEHKAHIRLVAEPGGARAAGEVVDSAVGDLGASAMRRQIGEVSEDIGVAALEELVAALEKRHPRLDILWDAAHKQTLVVRIPTVIQMVVEMKRVGAGSGAVEIGTIRVQADDEAGLSTRHHVFERISYDAQIFWFSIAGFSTEHRLSRTVQWFSQFEDLFAATCSSCRRHLQIDPRTSQLLPPLWRDAAVRGAGSAKAFHYGCLEAV